jgi:pimeloyl-ACP methyl ester carboxylesterase
MWLDLSNGLTGSVGTTLQRDLPRLLARQTGLARRFIDFWMGDGSWNLMPAERRAVIADAVVNVRRWSHALFTERTPAKAFANVRIPVLYMVGDNSPESAHAVARVLLPVLPRVRAVHLPGLGHMAPVTDPETINAEIARFLGEV